MTLQLPLLIGTGAGLASAALYASAWTGTALGIFVLLFLSPLPVAIAGLGWGWGSGALAAAIGTLVVLLADGPRTGLVYVLSMAAPAAVFSWLALLNRPSGDGGPVEWYPVGRIVAWATLWAGLMSVAAMLSIGSDTDSIHTYLLQMLERSRLLETAGAGGAPLTDAQKNAFAGLMTVFMPWAIATTWFAVAMANLWAAAHVTHRSGRLTRPWPDLSSVTMPPAMPLAFGLAALATFASGMPGLLGSGFASALVFAFMLVGLGLVHRMTQGYAIRPFVLGLVYTALLFVPPFSNLLVALLGLAEPFLRNRLPPPVLRPPPPPA